MPWVFYRPPSSLSSIFDTVTDALLTINQSCLTDLIIVGDFNVDFDPSHCLYPQLSQFMSNFSLSQIVKSPTHSSHAGHSSTIDLVLVSKPNNVKRCTVIPELANSDHLGLFVTMNQTQCVKANTITRKVWHYLQADFDRASEIIDTIDGEAELNSDDIAR